MLGHRDFCNFATSTIVKLCKHLTATDPVSPPALDYNLPSSGEGGPASDVLTLGTGQEPQI